MLIAGRVLDTALDGSKPHGFGGVPGSLTLDSTMTRAQPCYAYTFSCTGAGRTKSHILLPNEGHGSC